VPLWQNQQEASFFFVVTARKEERATERQLLPAVAAWGRIRLGDIMVKANGTKLCVFAAIARAGTASADFAIAGMTAKGTAIVNGEGRTLPVTAGRFGDTFQFRLTLLDKEVCALATG
jgi:hypothetical protein